MQVEHILRIGTDGKPTSLLSFDAQSKAHTTAISQWSDSSLKGNSLVLLLPATWLYQTITHIPSKSQEVLKKSIPFAIEEELSNEVEDNYYAYKQLVDGSQDVIAIEKSLLTDVGKAIKANRLKVLAIYSELDWVPKIPNAISVWFEDKYALIRFGDQQVMRAAEQQVSQLVTMFKGDNQLIHANQTEGLDGVDLPIKSDLTEHRCRTNLMGQGVIDLYLDEIKEAKQQQKKESWKLVGWLTGLLVVSWLGLQFYQIMQLDNAIDDLKSQQQTLFKDAFPDAAAAELVDPFAAIKSRMQLSANNASGPSSIFLDTVHHLGMVSSRLNQVQLLGLRLTGDKVEIQISAANLSLINQFHQQLQQNASRYNVQIGVNELTDENVYKSILTVATR